MHLINYIGCFPSMLRKSHQLVGFVVLHVMSMELNGNDPLCVSACMWGWGGWVGVYIFMPLQELAIGILNTFF